MPWCPKCGAEFRAGFTVCNTCRLPLIDHRPDGTERLPAADEPEEKWLRVDARRDRLLRILRVLAVLLIALAAALLLREI